MLRNTARSITHCLTRIIKIHCERFGQITIFIALPMFFMRYIIRNILIEKEHFYASAAR